MAAKARFGQIEFGISDGLPWRACRLIHPGDAMIRSNPATKATMFTIGMSNVASYRKRQIRSLLPIAFQRWWDTIDRESYHGLQLKAALKKLPELTLQRRQLGYLLAARTHHGDFADYHERFNHEDAVINCSRQKKKLSTG